MSKTRMEDIISEVMMDHGDGHIDGYEQIAQALRENGYVHISEKVKEE